MRGVHARVACVGSSFGRDAAAAAAADPGHPMMCHVDNFHESEAVLRFVGENKPTSCDIFQYVALILES